MKGIVRGGGVSLHSEYIYGRSLRFAGETQQYSSLIVNRHIDILFRKWFLIYFFPRIYCFGKFPRGIKAENFFYSGGARWLDFIDLI